MLLGNMKMSSKYNLETLKLKKVIFFKIKLINDPNQILNCMICQFQIELNY